MDDYQRSEHEISMMIMLDQLLSCMDIHDTVTVMRRVYCAFQRGILASALAVPVDGYECDGHNHSDMEEELYERPTRASATSISMAELKTMKETLQ